MPDRGPALSPRQRELLDLWLPGAVVERDHSWGIVATTVLEVTHAGERYIVKAGGEADHHLARELTAHRTWLGVWTSIGRAPRLVHADDAAKLLVTTYLPGELVLATESVRDPDPYRQAGELLARFHGQHSEPDPAYEERMAARSLATLGRPHRIAPDTERRLRSEVGRWPDAPPAPLVPTHGDWQPRNWLVHEGVVSVIDLGRAALRPVTSDLTRLAAQEFRGAPGLEAAFFAGYGHDPRELDPEGWRRERLREAIGTAVWAHEIGDEAFEAQGHRMIADALA